MRNLRTLLAVLAATGMASSALAEHNPRELVRTDDQGLIRVSGLSVPEPWRNPAWPEEEERAYWQRANTVIRHFQGRLGVNTHGENEKATYPMTMFNYLLGQHGPAIEALQSEDLQGGTDHAWTRGIDYYWAFTLKGQMRKYFWFGPDLTPAYRQRMREAGRIWTENDPRPSFELVNSLQSSDPMVREYALELLTKFRQNIAELEDGAVRGTVPDQYAGEDLGESFENWQRWWRQYAEQGWQTFEDIERLANPFPHPRHGTGTGPVGDRWDPEVRGMRVDARNTDNLRAMRDIAVYLMAEETGNERVRRLYKDKIQRFVTNLYRVHHGEWDSENYLHHTIAPYHNLYDFAQDEEVVALAKAALDYLYTVAAVKYYRGHAMSPTKRTGGGLERYMWMLFGDTPQPVSNPEYDLLHVVTSGYRMPLAVLNVGRNRFDRPAEMINTKPAYELWLPGAADQPRYWETLFYGRTYYLGTMVSPGAGGDERAWDMAMDTSDGGARRFRVNSGTRLQGKNARDQIGQYRNLAVWLRRDNSARFTLQLPGQANVTIEDGTWFVEHEQTWLAIRPIHITEDAIAPVGRTDRGNVEFRAQQTGGQYAGFAMLVGEAPDYRSFDDFRSKVRQQQWVDLSQVDNGRVTLRSEGRTLGYTYNPQNDLPRIERDGELYDWSQRHDVYGPMDNNAPVQVQWRSGTLRVRAGGHAFEQTVDEDGRVQFRAR